MTLLNRLAMYFWLAFFTASLTVFMGSRAQNVPVAQLEPALPGWIALVPTDSPHTPNQLLAELRRVTP